MEIIEREIGEIFEFEGKKIEVKLSSAAICEGCILDGKCTRDNKSITGVCEGTKRNDNTEVIFAEVQEQPQKLNLCEILKCCPKGTKLYSTIFGEVEFLKVNNIHQIVVTIGNKYYYFSEQGVFLLKGIIYLDHHGECVLFPSKDQRDWSKFVASWLKKEKFDPKTLKALNKILLRDECGRWHCGSFSHINKDGNYKFGCFELKYKYYIPYNDETRYLIGTTEEAPEYYRYWEDYPKME